MNRRDLLKLVGLGILTSVSPSMITEGAEEKVEDVVDPVCSTRGGPIEIKDSAITFRTSDKNVKLKIGAAELVWDEEYHFEYQIDRGCLDKVVPVENTLRVSLDFQYDAVDDENWINIIRQADPGDLDILISTKDGHQYEFNGFAWENLFVDLANAQFSIAGQARSYV